MCSASPAWTARASKASSSSTTSTCADRAPASRSCGTPTATASSAESPPDEDGQRQEPEAAWTLDSEASSSTAETTLAEAVEKSRAKSRDGDRDGAPDRVRFLPWPWPRHALQARMPSTMPRRELWRNRAITDPFEPGSTLKVFSAAAALTFANISPKTVFNCENGAYRIGKNTVHDVHRYGLLSLQDIIKYSRQPSARWRSARRSGRKNFTDPPLAPFGFGQRKNPASDSAAETAGFSCTTNTGRTSTRPRILLGHGVSAVGGAADHGPFSAIRQRRRAHAAAHRPGHPLISRGYQILRQFPPRDMSGRSSRGRQTASHAQGDLRRPCMLPGGTGLNARGALTRVTAPGGDRHRRKIDRKRQTTTKRPACGLVPSVLRRRIETAAGRRGWSSSDEPRPRSTGARGGAGVKEIVPGAPSAI